MSKFVSLYEAKARLSELIGRAARGEEIIIAKAGTPKARLVPLRHAAVKRRPGAWNGRVRIVKDFDAPLQGAVFAELEGDRGDDE